MYPHISPCGITWTLAYIRELRFRCTMQWSNSTSARFNQKFSPKL